jgi:hypothetical protein
MSYEDTVRTVLAYSKYGMVTARDPRILKEKEMCLNNDALFEEDCVQRNPFS